VWIALLRSPLFEAVKLSHLTKGYYGASIMPVEVLKELASRLPAVRLWNLYGQTEIAPLATMLAPQDQLRKPGSCGKAVLNVETRVVNDAMQDVAVGEVGEIVHRSPHLMLAVLAQTSRGGRWLASSAHGSGGHRQRSARPKLRPCTSAQGSRPTGLRGLQRMRRLLAESDASTTRSSRSSRSI
jgi:acyl-CoA synthetase (AMP-forming)/AMP-acid ligase II